MAPDARNIHEISPQYLGVASLIASIDINSSGKASSVGIARLSNNSYSVDLLVELQKYDSSKYKWTTEKSWTASGSGYSGASKEGVWYVSRGTYRTKVTATVYNAQGRFVEEPIAYSPSRTY